MNRKFLFGAFLLSTTACISVANAATDVADYNEFLTAVSAGGNINLTQDTDFPSTGGATFVLGNIAADTTIDGNGHAINGSNVSTGFSVESNKNFTLKNIGTIGSNFGFSGFAHNITNNGGTVTLDKVLLANNKTRESTTIAGAIFNNDTGTAIIKDSVLDNNYAASESTATWGGLIKNGVEGNTDAANMQISGSTFRNNFIETLPPSIAASHGGVIINYSTIDFVRNSLFENNKMTAAENSWGGNHGTAIDNQQTGYIKEISDSTFRNNKTFRTGDTVYTDGRNYHASAAAIDNYHTIDLIKNVLFENNTAESVASSATGGAVMSVSADGYYATIGSIENSRFINNHAKSEKKQALGGAISSSGTINTITGTKFENNYVQSDKEFAYGGALANGGSIGEISNTTFSNNFAYSEEGRYAYGGAMTNAADIGAITNTTFENNYAYSVNMGRGGAIYSANSSSGSDSRIGSITNSRFVNNSAGGQNKQSSGGAVCLNSSSDRIENVIFDGNTVSGKSYYSLAGALLTGKDVGIVKDITFVNNGVFVSNESASAGAWFNNGTVTTMKNLLFSGNHIDAGTKAAGGAMYNQGTLPQFDATFNNNKVKAGAEAYGGALYNKAVGTVGAIKGNFAQNSVEGTTIAYGGAVFNAGRIENIVNSSFVGNYAKATDIALGGAIYSQGDLTVTASGGDTVFAGNYVETAGVKTPNDIYMSDGTTLKLIADRGSINFGGGIDGEDYQISINGNGTVNFDGAIKNAGITQGTASTGGLGTSAIDNITVNVADGSYLAGNSLTLNSGDLNIANLNGRAELSSLTMNGGNINIQNLGVDLRNITMGSLTAGTYTDNGGSIIINNINLSGDGASPNTSLSFTTGLLTDNVRLNIDSATGPIWRYNISYDSSNGMLRFARPHSPTPRDINPQVMVPAIAVTTTAAAMNNEIHSRVLNDVDALKDSTANVSSADRSIKNAWVKGFGSDTTVGFKDFVGVDTKFAGLIGGLSSDRINEGKGWSAIYSVYGAYIGGEQKFAGEKITNHGGYLGLGANFYHGDFFVGATVNGGLVSNRPAGSDKDRFNSYMGGIAVKTGYDYRFGNFTIEPNVYASYTIVSAEDYVTPAGSKVKSDSIDIIEAAPGLKLAQSFDNGLKGYISGRYVWTFTQDQDMTVSNFNLPDIELKDYAEYGIGLEKSWADRAAGFVEIKRRDGGQNGWNFNLGYKHSF